MCPGGLAGDSRAWLAQYGPWLLLVLQLAWRPSRADSCRDRLRRAALGCGFQLHFAGRGHAAASAAWRCVHHRRRDVLRASGEGSRGLARSRRVFAAFAPRPRRASAARSSHFDLAFAAFASYFYRVRTVKRPPRKRAYEYELFRNSRAPYAILPLLYYGRVAMWWSAKVKTIHRL